MASRVAHLTRHLRHTHAHQAAARARTLSTMAASIPDLHFGNMTFAWTQASSYVDDDIATKMMGMFQEVEGVYFDTARIYAGGKSEEMAGRIMAGQKSHDQYKIITKAHPSQEGGLSPAGLRAQLEASLKALQAKKVQTLYLHQPDTTHAVEETLACCSELVKEGLVDQIGLSNFHASEVDRIVKLCKAKGFVAPSVFQGLYNPINRRVHEELFPTLQEHGLDFIAYNPLAAGMLTGKHTQDGEVLTGRFKENPNYLNRFYTKETFAALDVIKDACDKHAMSMTQATYSWMLFHSTLKKGDGVLLGASKVEHLKQNLECCTNAKELPADIVAAFDQGWELSKPVAAAYWRSYSGDFPDRESLDQGLSYNPSKK